ncbi:WecB/TagA/CpsF family glycosyltransferase [Rhodobacteraceae bacterium S2214]|nr:WecB/TagA/CpsF family glycosyltransferase [Rhodobacteraceae bacterium S2214]
MLQTISLFGLSLLNADRATAVQHLLERPGQTTAAFLNAHCVNTAAKDKLYKRALRAADVILPDGAGISLAAKLIGRRLRENLNGTDLCEPLCRGAAARGMSVYLLGAAPGVAQEAADNLCLKIPGLQIAGAQDGFFDRAYSNAMIEKINASGADIVMVAMGVPLQDVWLYQHRKSINAKLVMGVGALFDFKAGRVSRAPAVVRKAKLEWAWRLALEPRRMFKRYVLGNPAFVARAMVQAGRTRRITAPAMTVSKRALDISVASVALVALSPVFVTTAVAVKMTSRGPVFFKQDRVGHRGTSFSMIKFRSMYQDAETRRDALVENSEREGVCFKMRADPRITRVGRFIRRYSIDELPQILNVLRGEMSLVGPRPALPSEVAMYPAAAMRRLNAIPGITGIWQVSGRADIGFSRMVAMDVTYLRSKSIMFDLLLMGLTVRAVLSGRGAY